MTRVKEKITSIECHVEYAHCEFQTLHNEAIQTTEDKLFDETGQRLAYKAILTIQSESVCILQGHKIIVTGLFIMLPVL